MIRRTFSAIVVVSVALIIAPTAARAQVSAVTIVLPPRLLANAPATLAVLGTDGHLVPGQTVEIGGGKSVTTDATGRASFTAPANGAFIATAAGVSAAALVDGEAAHGTALTVAPDVSQHDHFSICGGGFRGDTGGNTVKINGDPAFVLAASPVCLVILPAARTPAGPAKIEIDSLLRATLSTTLVSLDFLPSKPALLPGAKGWLTVRAGGTRDALPIIVENHSPDVIQFLRGDTQQLHTSGGAQNEARLEVKAIRSGDFSFRARIVAPPDPAAAARYIQIAQAAAPASLQRELNAAAKQIAQHPKDTTKPRTSLDRIAAGTSNPTLKALLDAARDSL